MFWRNTLLTSPGSTSTPSKELAALAHSSIWKKEAYVPAKHLRSCTRLHGITTQKIVLFMVTAVITAVT
jgi:N-acetylmuramic acid 6-phosphate (MurNAc-6-P) etherase